MQSSYITQSKINSWRLGLKIFYQSMTISLGIEHDYLSVQFGTTIYNDKKALLQPHTQGLLELLVSGAHCFKAQ